MNDSVFMAELSWPEFERRVAENVIVFFPLGATEQHGPHLAMSVDVVLPTAVCERVARSDRRPRRADHSLRLQVAAALGRRRGVSGHDQPRRPDLLARRPRRHPQPRP